MNMLNQFARSLGLIAALSLSGCSSDGPTSNTSSNGVPKAPRLSEIPAADYELLFMGNSHSSANGLPALVVRLIEALEQAKTANAVLAPGYSFLDERINDGVTQEMLNARQWTHVFLQAQKYSTTGRYSYSTDAAQEWIRRIKALSARPVMFPEWPRRGNKEEGRRIYQLHLSIAGEEPACVAPVGPVWDESLLRHPEIRLHAGDGNHSNLNGALLTAYVFFQVITSKQANVLEYVPQIPVDAQIQAKLRAVALDFHNVELPCP